MDKLSKKAIVFCKMAYTNDFNGLKYTFIENKITDTQCYIIPNNNDLFIVYRGTEKKLKDIFTDFKFWRKRIPFSDMRDNTKIKGHAGFLDAYHSIREKLHDIVITTDAERIIHCGHSLGGALAQWSILDCKHYYPKKRQIGITFGQPAIGNLALNKSFKHRINEYYRFVNWFDFVTLLPFTSLHAIKKIQTKEIGHNINKYKDAIL